MSAGKVDVLAVMAKGGVTARIERRQFYIDGKYHADPPFLPCQPDALAAELTGDFYGEWNGTRHVDGRATLAADIERALDYTLSVSGRVAHHGDCCHYPTRLGDWGEYRIVTNDAALARIGGAP